MPSSVDADRIHRDSLVNRIENYSLKRDASLHSSRVGGGTHIGTQLGNIDNPAEARTEINIRSSRGTERRQGGVFHNRVNSTDRYSFMKRDPTIRSSNERARSRARSRNRPNSTEIFALGMKNADIRSSHDTDRTRVGMSHSRLNSADHLSLARRDTNNKSTVSLADTIVQRDIGNRSWLTGNSFETERNFDFGFDFDLENQEKRRDEAPDLPPEKEQKDPDLVEWDGPGDPGRLILIQICWILLGELGA